MDVGIPLRLEFRKSRTTKARKHGFRRLKVRVLDKYLFILILLYSYFDILERIQVVQQLVIHCQLLAIVLGLRSLWPPRLLQVPCFSVCFVLPPAVTMGSDQQLCPFAPWRACRGGGDPLLLDEGASTRTR